jgi:hypothetical protein
MGRRAGGQHLLRFYRMPTLQGPSFTICRQMSNQVVNLSWQHRSVATRRLVSPVPQSPAPRERATSGAYFCCVRR